MKYLRTYEKFEVDYNELVDSLISFATKCYPDSKIEKMKYKYDRDAKTIVFTGTENLGLPRLVDRYIKPTTTIIIRICIKSFLWLVIENCHSQIRIGLSPLPDDNNISLMYDEIRNFTINRILIPIFEEFNDKNRGNEDNFFIDSNKLYDLVNRINNLTEDDFNLVIDVDKYNL